MNENDVLFQKVTQGYQDPYLQAELSKPTCFTCFNDCYVNVEMLFHDYCLFCCCCYCFMTVHSD